MKVPLIILSLLPFLVEVGYGFQPTWVPGRRSSMMKQQIVTKQTLKKSNYHYHQLSFKAASSSFSPILLLMSNSRMSISSATHTNLSASTSADKNNERSKEKGEEEWTKKRLHNSPIFRSGSMLVALLIAGLVSPNNSPFAKVSTRANAMIHMMSFATWFGTAVYTTFIAGITMFKVLPRKVFGKLQSNLFPKYFQLLSTCMLLQILTLRYLPTLGIGGGAIKVSLLMTLLNQFYLEPKATKIMFDRYELDDIPGGTETLQYKELKASFGKLHGMSSLTNLIALCGGIVHGYYLSSAFLLT